MKVLIADHEFAIQWDGVYYFPLSDYPHISAWELKKLVLFARYEKTNGRELQIQCEDQHIMNIVSHSLSQPDSVSKTEMPAKITGCTSCKQKGCLTKFLCHTASAADAKSILSCGHILSAVNARKMTGAELAKEKRNAAGDSADYFTYVMLSWGNCPAGDRLVMERMLGRQPTAHDLSEGFMPGVRFFFRYDTIASLSNCVFDGYHAAKVRDSIELSANLFACIIPKHLECELAGFIPEQLANRVHFINNDCNNLWDWTEKVYNFVVTHDIV